MSIEMIIAVIVVVVAVIVAIASNGELNVAKARIYTLEQNLQFAEAKAPVEKEVIKYVDRIVEKQVEIPVEKIVEVPVEKEVVKYVDRIIEKKVENVVNPTLKEKERMINEGKKKAEEIILEAELKAEQILSSSKEECERMKRETELQASRSVSNTYPEIREKIIEVPVEKIVEVPVEKEIIKYVDRVVEKEVEVSVEKIVKVPVEKEVIKYVDRIVEKKVENVINPTLKEKERMINEGKKKAEEIVFEAELKAEQIVSASKEECKRMIREAELQISRLELKVQPEIREKIIESPVEKIVEVPVEKEVIKYVDRIVEKQVEVPVERIVEPSSEEKERLIAEGKKEAEKIILEAELKAEKIVSASKTIHENECKSIVRKAKEEAKRIKETAENEMREQKQNLLAGEERIRKREEVLEHWSSELQRKEAYNLTRSENHRKEALKLKHEAKDIRDDMLKQGFDYLSDLQDRIGRLMEITRIEDESLLDTISKELAEKKKRHKQRMKEETLGFAEANFHDLPYDSRKVCLLAVTYCDLLADTLIGNIHKTGVENALEKVRKAIETTEAIFPASVEFRISDSYIQSKKEQIQLAYEIEVYKREQKEIRRQQLEAAREELRAQKELEAERKKAEKDEMEAQTAIERNRYEMAQAKTQAEMDKYREQILRLEEALKQAQERRERALSMAQQTKCGYVYVISNIGSFGEGVYKIGMTRRVEPMERVVELGDASVPFPFDVHAMIYTEDAPGLEASLHRAFDDRKVNAVNGRKEFFRVSLPEVREQVEKFGIVCDWVDKPTASQYRDSVHLRV